jgi:hypothetical protein
VRNFALRKARRATAGLDAPRPSDNATDVRDFSAIGAAQLVLSQILLAITPNNALTTGTLVKGICGSRRSSRPHSEETMAKGQMKSSKETKKPKADKPKTTVSAYKLAQGKGPQQAPLTPGKKT